MSRCSVTSDQNPVPVRAWDWLSSEYGFLESFKEKARVSLLKLRMSYFSIIAHYFLCFVQVIYRVQAMESRNDPLPVSMTGIRGKGPKR